MVADGVEFEVRFEKKGAAEDDKTPGEMEERDGEGRGTSLGDSKEACLLMCECGR